MNIGSKPLAINPGDTIVETMNVVTHIEDVARFPQENPYPVMRVDQTGILIFANTSSLDLLNQWHCSRGQTIPLPYRTLVQQACQTGKLTFCEVTSDEKALSLAIVPVAGKDYANIYGQDITRRKRVLQKLRQTRASLQKTVYNKTQELQETIQTLMGEVQERIETEAELRENQARLAEAQRIAGLGNWHWDLENNFLSWSPEVYRIFGVNADSFMPSYEAFTKFVHPEDHLKVQEAVNQALQGHGSYRVDHRIIRPDGQEREVEERGEVTWNAQRQAIAMQGTVQDLTSLRSRERLLQQQARQLEEQAQLLELAHDTIIVHNMEGRILYWNHGAEQTYGWQRADAVGKICHDLLKTHFPQPLAEMKAILLETHQWEGELIHQTQAGQTIIAESRWALRCNVEGEATAVLEIDRDITLRKQAEQQTQQARIYAENIIATVQDALIVLDQDLRIVTVNRSFIQMFDLPLEQIQDKCLYHIQQGQWDQVELRRLLENILPHNRILLNYEIEWSCPDGEPLVLLLNARQLHQTESPSQMILMAIQDITTFKKQEQAIRAHEQRLHALTEELLMAEEGQREETAQALHDSIGPILSFTKRELIELQKKADPLTKDTLQRLTEQIGQAIQQTRSLTTELSPPTLRVFGLEAALEELGEEFAQQHGFDFIIQMPEQALPIAENHKVLLFRAVRELMVNIAKHAEAHYVKLTISQHDTQIAIEIADDGRGFEPTRIQTEGAEQPGFGLFSIRERLTYVGGSFEIQSQPQRGTTIILRAPIKVSSQEGASP